MTPILRDVEPDVFTPLVFGRKDDHDKPMWHLLPWRVLEGVVKTLTFGARKYSPDGWKRVENAKERYESALFRHFIQMKSGDYIDRESQVPHASAFLTNALILAYLYLKPEDRE